MSLLERIQDERPAAPWVAELAEAARANLSRSGLPGRKTEAWRFTSVKAIRDASFPAPDGGVDVEVSGDVLCERLPVGKEAAVPEWFGGLASHAQFAGVNLARFEELVFLRVPADGHGRASLRFRSTALSLPRVYVLLEPGASLELVERREDTGDELLSIGVVEIELRANAALHHVRLQTGGRGITTVAVLQKDSSRYQQRLVSLGGALSRTDVEVALDGEGAECQLRGAYHVSGEGLAHEHVDHHVRIVHRADRTRSEVDHRGLLDGEGVSVFDAQTIVGLEVRGVEAHQSNRNLLLSSGARVHTKPHLEISNDDIVASHGATVGALDPDALFYLRQRGIPEAKAKAMLTHSFLRAALDGMRDEALHAELDAALRGRLPHAEVLDLSLEESEDEAWDQLGEDA